MTERIRIWGRLSSINVRKVVLCAQWLGLSFERIEAGKAFGVVDTPEYLALNPNGLIPAMRHGDYVLWESNAIVRYLSAAFSLGNFYPTDLQARFDAERWMDWQQTTLNPAGGAAFIQWIRTPAPERNAALIAQSCERVAPLWRLLNAHLSTQSHMAGPRMGMADWVIAVEVHRWFSLPQPESKLAAYPALAAWYAPIAAHPLSHGVLDQELN